MHISRVGKWRDRRNTVVPLEDVNRALAAMGCGALTAEQVNADKPAVEAALIRYAATKVERCGACGRPCRSAPAFPGPYCKHVGVA